MQFFAILIVLFSSAGLTYLLATSFDVTGMLIGISVGVLLLLLTGLIFSVATSVFNTALYVYASNKTIASGFTEEDVKSAFRTKK